MKKLTNIIILFSLILFLSYRMSYGYTTEHHLVNMGRNLLNVIFSPLKGAIIKGPQEIKKMYSYEVHEREKPYKRGLLRYKIFALWRAPGVELKAIVDGVTNSIVSAGNFFKETLSIVFSD